MSKDFTEEELANLSDDELMGMAIPPSVSGSQEDTGDQAPVEPVVAPSHETGGEGSAGATAEDDDDEDDDPAPSAVPGSDDADDPAAGAANPLAQGDDEDKPTAQKAADKTADEAQKAGEAKPTDADPAQPTAVDYKAEYDKIMAPFKANGKEVKLNSPEEVVQLMQMGANYTKKLQALQPNLRLLKMLENNNLLDEGKISFLIDLEQKNPKAIQKLLKESGVDPLDIDTSTEPDYLPGNHKVSDEEMRFSSTLEEVASDPVGKEMIVLINKTWDAQSKEALWADPDLLKVMTAQKQSGIYDQISNEVERLRVLGKIGNHVPFLQSYRDVGMEMQQRGVFTSRQPATDGSPAPQNSSRVVETRAARPQASSNSERAKAASPTRSTPGKVKADFNPLSMSDEDFEKNAELAKRL